MTLCGRGASGAVHLRLHRRGDLAFDLGGVIASVQGIECGTIVFAQILRIIEIGADAYSAASTSNRRYQGQGRVVAVGKMVTDGGSEKQRRPA